MLDVVGYLEGYISALLLSCSITTGALGSPGLLPSCFLKTISLHITIILIMSLMSFYLSTSIGNADPKRDS